MSNDKRLIKRVDLLLKALEVVSVHAPDDAGVYVVDAVTTWLEEGGSLEERLQLKRGQGGRSIGVHYFTWKRNAYLKAAKACCLGENWDRCKAVSAQAKRYEQEWSAIPEPIDPDPRWSSLKTNLFHAYIAAKKAGLCIALSPTTIHDITREGLEVVGFTAANLPFKPCSKLTNKLVIRGKRNA